MTLTKPLSTSLNDLEHVEEDLEERQHTQHGQNDESIQSQSAQKCPELQSEIEQHGSNLQVNAQQYKPQNYKPPKHDVQSTTGCSGMQSTQLQAALEQHTSRESETLQSALQEVVQMNRQVQSELQQNDLQQLSQEQQWEISEKQQIQQLSGQQLSHEVSQKCEAVQSEQLLTKQHLGIEEKSPKPDCEPQKRANVEETQQPMFDSPQQSQRESFEKLEHLQQSEKNRCEQIMPQLTDEDSQKQQIELHQKQSKHRLKQPEEQPNKQKPLLFSDPLSDELHGLYISEEQAPEMTRINRVHPSPASSVSNAQPVVPTTLDLPASPPRRRKIFPSRDLLDDCEIEAAIQRARYPPCNGAPNICGYLACGNDEGASNGEDDGSAHWEEESWSECGRTPQSLETPDYYHGEVFDGQLDWNDTSRSHTDDVSPGRDRCDSPSSRLESEENERWRTVEMGDRKHRIDLKVVEPYKRILSHGGYYGDGFNTIVVLTASYLPDKRRRDYHYVMRNLFLYVISTLELLVMDEYTVVYFHGSVSRQRMPSFRWLKQCYQMIDRKFKKNLKRLLIVHPTFFLRTIMVMSKPFISSKFYAKLKYVRSLEELCQLVPMDHLHISDEIKTYDVLKNGSNSINAL